MGLDTTHDCWHGAYSAFMRWRREIAGIIGIPLSLMEGYYNALDDTLLRDRLKGTSLELTLLPFLPIKWDALKPDPLHILLDHSDCEGWIPWKYCGSLADRLEEILPQLTGRGGGHIGEYQEKTKQFIAGLRLAASRQENVEFY